MRVIQQKVAPALYRILPRVPPRACEVTLPFDLRFSAMKSTPGRATLTPDGLEGRGPRDPAPTQGSIGSVVSEAGTVSWCRNQTRTHELQVPEYRERFAVHRVRIVMIHS